MDQGCHGTAVRPHDVACPCALPFLNGIIPLTSQTRGLVVAGDPVGLLSSFPFLPRSTLLRLVGQWRLKRTAQSIIFLDGEKNRS